MQWKDMLNLEPHGPDTWVGVGPSYPWGGLFGGQIMAQGLMAAAQSVPEGFGVHSLHAYFIRRGNAEAPIRFEVDRIRDGRTFATRRVVARQSAGAIFNMSASFHTGEAGPQLQTRTPPAAPAPDTLPSESWSDVFDRRVVRGGPSAGASAAWFRVQHPLPEAPLHHACALAFVSDDLPTEALVAVHPDRPASIEALWAASLDHAMWFHAPLRADAWHLHDFACQALGHGRGLTLGHVFSEAGQHVATVTQEVLLRRPR